MMVILKHTHLKTALQMIIFKKEINIFVDDSLCCSAKEIWKLEFFFHREIKVYLAYRSFSARDQ